MVRPPIPKDWKTLLEKQLKKAAYNEADTIRLIYTCQDYVSEIQSISQWISQQLGFVNQMANFFGNMYFTMYGKQPPPRPTEALIKEVFLETPEDRKRAIREVALSVTEPGGEVSDEVVLEELKRHGMRIDMQNPTAAISTILKGFKPQFEKVQGKRGIFKRRQ